MHLIRRQSPTTGRLQNPAFNLSFCSEYLPGRAVHLLDDPVGFELVWSMLDDQYITQIVDGGNP